MKRSIILLSLLLSSIVFGGEIVSHDVTYLIPPKLSYSGIFDDNMVIDKLFGDNTYVNVMGDSMLGALSITTNVPQLTLIYKDNGVEGAKLKLDAQSDKIVIDATLGANQVPINFSGILLKNIKTPEEDHDVATKKYVDDHAGSSGGYGISTYPLTPDHLSQASRPVLTQTVSLDGKVYNVLQYDGISDASNEYIDPIHIEGTKKVIWTVYAYMTDNTFHCNNIKLIAPGDTETKESIVVDISNNTFENCNDSEPLVVTNTYSDYAVIYPKAVNSDNGYFMVKKIFYQVLENQ